MIKEVDSMRTMGALITKEADSMSAMKFRMIKTDKADKAMWLDAKFYQNNGIAEGRKHRRYREVVQSCLLHSCESWSWKKEMIDALHGWESRNLDMMSSKRWAQMDWVSQPRHAEERSAGLSSPSTRQRCWVYFKNGFKRFPVLSSFWSHELCSLCFKCFWRCFRLCQVGCVVLSSASNKWGWCSLFHIVLLLHFVSSCLPSIYLVLYFDCGCLCIVGLPFFVMFKLFSVIALHSFCCLSCFSFPRCLSLFLSLSVNKCKIVSLLFLLCFSQLNNVSGCYMLFSVFLGFLWGRRKSWLRLL